MQIKNPKTGEVFENIHDAMEQFCPANKCSCAFCPISSLNNGHKMMCHDFCIAHPAEAARRMGYMVVADGTDGPQLTDQEITIMKTMGAKWVSRDKGENSEYVELWDTRPNTPVEREQNVLLGRMKPLAKVAQNLFPSIRPGGRVCVDDQTGKDA